MESKRPFEPKAAWEPEQLSEVLKAMMEQQNKLHHQLEELGKTLSHLKSGENTRDVNRKIYKLETLDYLEALKRFFTGGWMEISSRTDVEFKNQVVQESQNLSIISALMLNLFVPVIFQVMAVNSLRDIIEYV